MSNWVSKLDIEADTVIVVDVHGVDEEYNTKTHPGLRAELVDVGNQVELVIRIPIPPGSSPQTRQAPRVDS
jgi:hypothetical protein